MAYRGDITSEIITDVLEEIEDKLEQAQEQSKVKKRVYYVLVEALQNLYHHKDEVKENGNAKNNDLFSLFLISKDETSYTITTGNFVESDKKDMLRNRINHINSLTKDEIKSLYRIILNNQEFSEKGGGGLGIIDIARKTGNKLKYAFEDLDEKLSFFSLTISFHENKNKAN